VLSGALERHITLTEAVLPPDIATHPLIAEAHHFLTEARRHAAARRWQAAVRALETAAQLARGGQPTIQAARGKAALAKLGPLKAELARLAPLAAHSEASRQAARERATPTRQAIAAYWHEQVERLAREILREKPDRVMTRIRLAQKIAERLQREIDDKEGKHHHSIAAIRGVPILQKDPQPLGVERVRTLLRSLNLT
jgi:hypothetical protein